MVAMPQSEAYYHGRFLSFITVLQATVFHLDHTESWQVFVLHSPDLLMYGGLDLRTRMVTSYLIFLAIWKISQEVGNDPYAKFPRMKVVW